MTAVLLDSILQKSFPFHFSVNSEWEIERIGPSLSRMLSDDLHGTTVERVFNLNRDSADSLESFFKKYEGILLFLEDRNSGLRYKAQLFISENKDSLYFLQSPIIPELGILEDKGLLFTDFSLSDPVLDYLIMGQSNKELLEKSRKLISKLEQSKKAAEAASKKYMALLKVVMHDLANPLSAVKMGVDRLVRKAAEPDRVLSRVQKSSNAMVEIIELTRDSILTDGTVNDDSEIKIKCEPINIISLIDESLEIFSQSLLTKELGVDVEVKDRNLTVVSDRRILVHQIFSNILSNAIKFSYQKNRILINLETDPDSVVISFRDFGTGIAKDVLSEILTSSRRITKNGTHGEKGTGIGIKNLLYFAKVLNVEVNIVSNQDTSESSGTTVQIIIPRS